MIECTPDIYQLIRMTLIWPVIVGCVAFYQEDK